MADPQHDKTEGAPPRSIHVEGEEKKTNWLAWLLLGLGLLALLFALSRCNRNDAVVVDNTTNTVDTFNTTDTLNTNGPITTNNVGNTAGTSTSATVRNTGELGTYLAGTEAAPSTFTFDKLNFATASSAVRAEDGAEVSSIAATLKQYPNTRVRVQGYADSRGADAANAKLGLDRANSVKAALVAAGIDAGRIEAVTGGETDPVDSNATTTGQAENRRTELVVTQR